MNCQQSEIFKLTDFIHILIFMIGLFTETLLLFFLSRFSHKQMPLKFPFLVLYSCGGLYLFSHCLLTLWIRISSSKQYSMTFLSTKFFLEESFGTAALWSTTLISLIRVYMIHRNKFSIKRGWWYLFLFIISLPIATYAMKKFFHHQIVEQCDCANLLVRLTVYLFRVIPAITMIMANLVLAFQIRQQYFRRKHLAVVPAANPLIRVSWLVVATASSLMICATPLTVLYLLILYQVVPQPCAFDPSQSIQTIDGYYEVLCIVYDINYLMDIVIFSCSNNYILSRFHSFRAGFRMRWQQHVVQQVPVETPAVRYSVHDDAVVVHHA